MKNFQHCEEFIKIKTLNCRSMLLLAILILCISLACSKSLSRNEASKLVAEYLQSQDETIEIQFGNEVFLWDFDKIRMQRFAKAGLLRISSNYSRYKIQFTNEGKKYFASEVGKVVIGYERFKVDVKLAAKLLVEISGITEAPFYPEKQAFNVEYRWRYSNFTPFGENETLGLQNERIWSEEVRDKIFDGKAMIRLYDDGWRIVK